MAPLFAIASANAELAQIIELGLQHEQQHQELILTDVKHLLSRNPLAPAYRRPRPLPPHAAPLLRWIAHDGGLTEVGADGSGFAFDNESPRHRVYVAPFELAAHPVTNREYLAFIDDGGYRRPELWLALGWDIVQAQKWEAPLYWDRRDGGCTTFSLAGRVEVAPDTPLVHVSLFEADAFARWAGARLPTEFEWEVAARGARIDGNFLDSGALHPLPPDVAPSESAPAQMFGDVWEWTQQLVRAVPRLRARARRGRRIQRQVHVQPVRAARRVLRDAPLAHPRHVPQFLPAGSALAVLGRSPRTKHSLSAEFYSAWNTAKSPAGSCQRRTRSNPARPSSAAKSSGAYLNESSVWMRSPAANSRRPSARATRCGEAASRCISTRPEAAA